MELLKKLLNIKEILYCNLVYIDNRGEEKQLLIDRIKEILEEEEK